MAFRFIFFGVMVAIGILAGIYVAYLEVKRKKLDVDKIFDIAICSIIAAVVGARLFFILFYDLSYYLENLMEIILWRKRKTIEYDGQLFIWYVILFSVNRGTVEIFRINPYIIGGFSVSHLLGLLFIIGAVAHVFSKKALR